MGLQLLLAIDWRPNCSQAQDSFVERHPPPPPRREAPILIGPPSANAWPISEDIYSYEDNPHTQANTMLIEVNIRVC